MSLVEHVLKSEGASVSSQLSSVTRLIVASVVFATNLGQAAKLPAPMP